MQDTWVRFIIMLRDIHVDIVYLVIYLWLISSDYTASNGSQIYEHLNGKDLEGNGHDLIRSTIPVFDWGN
jgi:hypothetical protein